MQGFGFLTTRHADLTGPAHQREDTRERPAHDFQEKRVDHHETAQQEPRKRPQFIPGCPQDEQHHGDRAKTDDEGQYLETQGGLDRHDAKYRAKHSISEQPAKPE